MDNLELRPEIEGKSGCEVEITLNNLVPSLRKSSFSIEYNSRLEKQIQKQKKFKDYHSISAPNIKNIYLHNSLFVAEMEYINGALFHNFFLDANLSILNTKISELVNFLKYEINESKEVKVPILQILTKLKSLRNSYKNNNLFQPFRRYFEFLDNIPNSGFLSGEYHGDLTLSNIIFARKKIYLIDFLDSFIDNPIQDIVKLRQDTKFHYSLYLLNLKQRNSTAFVRIMQVLNYFDDILKQSFQNGIYYQYWYKYLEVFNLMRIIPYLKKEEDILFIQNCLEKCNI